MGKEYLTPVAIVLSAVLISCAIVYDNGNDSRSSFLCEQAVASTVEVICGSGFSEVSGTGLLSIMTGPK